MPHSLLHTKLYMPPARPGLVPRPRLTARLAQGLERPLTLISAPAGFGKTTLLAEWRATPAGRDYPLAWFSLDAGDDDPPRFWDHAVAALRTLPALAGAAQLGAASLELLRAAPGLPPEHFLPLLLNELAAARGPFALVLDDYHLIAAPPVHAAIHFLVQHMPPPLRLVVLTRADPPWPLARLRAGGQVAELRAADLRFTDAEAAALLAHHLPGGLAPADVAALQRRTEGWAVALRLAALSLAGQAGPADRRAFVAAFAGEHRHVADYLAEEVISRQPEPVQQFLLRTSVLERLTAPLCAAVTGQDDAGAMLEQVERANLFLTTLDDQRRWFRYHHLFADLLQARLRQAQPELVPVLHRRASEWHEAAGHPLPAVTHALAAGDDDRAARLLEQHVHGWWGLASSEYLRLMARLPEAVIRRRPTFCVYQAWVGIVTGRLDMAAALIAAAEQQLGPGPDSAGAGPGPDPAGAGPGPDPADPGPGRDPAVLGAAALHSFMALMRTYIAELTGRPYQVSAAVLAAPGHIPAAQVAMRNSAEVVLAFILYMNGDLDPAAALLSAAAERDLAARLTNAVPIAISRLARLRIVQGRLGAAADLCRRHLNIIAERSAGLYFVNGSLNGALADVLREQNDLDGAEAQARESVAQNEAWGIPDALASSHLTLARVLLSRGDAAGAAGALARAGELAAGRTFMTDMASLRQVLQVRLWLRQGDVAAARRWADERGLHPGEAPSFRREAELLALARILLAEGRWADAQALLGRLAAAAAGGGRTGRLIEALALQALALRRHEPERALGALEQALAMAEPEGHARTFLDEGEPMAGLLRHLAGRGGPAAAYAARLLAACPPPATEAPAAAAAPHEALPEPLSDRETEVLRLLAAGLSNQEIAGRLVVSVGTVKTHVHHIYGKLGAAGRTRAVARARELGLI